MVNDIWGGETLFEWNAKLWEHNLDNGLRLLRLAVDTHLITSHYALPLLIRRSGGLVVEMTDGTADYNASHYRVSAFYNLAKIAVLRLAWSQGHELAEFGSTAVALTPGWMRSEMMLDNYGVSEANWREALARPATPPYPDPGHFGISETPTFTGRAVAALAADPTSPGGTRPPSPRGSLHTSTAYLPTPPGTADQFLYYGTGHVGGLRVASGLEHDHVRQPGYPIHARRLNTYASRLCCQQQPLMPLSAR